MASESRATGIDIEITETMVAQNTGTNVQKLQRLREAGILSALGATPKMLARIYTIEFALIGAIAGMIGSAAACAFASMLLGLIFYRWEIAFGWAVVAGAMLCSVLLTTAAGWLPTFSLIRQKPMNVLRGI